MAINTGDTKFRKVNIDQYTDVAFQDEQINDSSSGLNINDINNLISKGSATEALLAVLQNCPIRSKDQSVKNAAFKCFMRSLAQIKAQNIDQILAQLDKDQIDLLMKYIYRGFEQPQDASCATLLTWHEKVYSIGKVGSIIRVITDRNRV